MTDPVNDYYSRIGRHDLAPLWEVMSNLVPPAPRAQCDPASWRYQEILPLLLESGALISAERAERRVLVLENPRLRGQSRITNTLYAGLQLLLPGEEAPLHRHTATAIRLILAGEGGTTTVEGEPTRMHRGDFIITPSMLYHAHRNPGQEAVVWLDGLDVPMVQFMDAGFSDRPTPGSVPAARVEDGSIARFASGLLPVEADAKPGALNPVFRYPFARTREALVTLGQAGDIHPAWGVKLQYSNPRTGGPATATMSAFMQWMPQGFQGVSHRSTDATVYCVVEGAGQSTVDGRALAWEKNDIFVAPSWAAVAHASRSDAIVFSMSDRAAQQALGLWRQEIGPVATH